MNGLIKICFTVLLISLNFLHIFSYKLFIFALAISFIIYLNIDLKLSGFEKILLKLTPISFYLFGLSSIFLETPRKSSIFWDMQDFLHFLKCNSNTEFVYVYKYINESRNCVESIGYGLLSEYLIFNGDIWITTLAIFLLFSFLILYKLVKLKQDIFLFVVFLVSPSFTFLIFSLNFDLFVFIYFLYLFNKLHKGWNYFDLVVLSLLTQLKLYPISLLIGYFLYLCLVNKKSKIFVYFTGLFAILNIGLVVYFLVALNPFIPDPLSYTRTFGILHDINLLNKIIGFDEAIMIIGVLLVLMIILLVRYKFNYILNFLKIDLSYEEMWLYFIFFPTSIMINLFQNWGYKFIFNFFIIFLLYKNSKKSLKLFFLILLVSNTTYYLIGYGFVANWESYVYLIISKITFYFYVLISVSNFYFSLQKNFQRNL